VVLKSDFDGNGTADIGLIGPSGWLTLPGGDFDRQSLQREQGLRGQLRGPGQPAVPVSVTQHAG
jgi:hypothetical protein